jgi:hypothetical protein
LLLVIKVENILSQANEAIVKDRIQISIH